MTGIGKLKTWLTSKESGKSLLFVTSFLFMLIFAIVFGFMKRPTEMGLSIIAGLMGMSFTQLGKIAEISGAGIKLKTRKLDKTIETATAKLEDIEELSEHLVDAIVDASTGIGALFLELGKDSIAIDTAMKGINYYAHRPVERSKNRVDAMLSGIIGKLASPSSKQEIVKLFQEKGKAALKTYRKMKENNVPSEVIEKFEKILDKTGIDYKTS